MSDVEMMTRNEVARALHRQPRYVTGLFTGRLLSYVKLGNQYFVRRKDFENFILAMRKKGRIS